MNKSSYSASELTRIMKIFDDNEVKLEFQNFDNLYDCFDKVMPITIEAYFRNYRKKNYHSIFFEHDIQSKQLTNYIKVYTYFDLCFFDQNLINFVKALTEALILDGVTEGMANDPANCSGIRQLNDDFGLCYDLNNIFLGYYFCCVFDVKKITDKQVEILYYNLGFVEMPIHKKMREISTKFLLYCVAYSPSKHLGKMQYCVNTDLFYNNEIKRIFLKYSNFYTILDTILESEMDEINIQFDANNANYIALEVFPDITKIDKFLNELVELRLLSVDEKEYIINNKKTKSELIKGYAVKFRWDNLDSYTVKWYNKHSSSKKT